MAAMGTNCDMLELRWQGSGRRQMGAGSNTFSINSSEDVVKEQKIQSEKYRFAKNLGGRSPCCVIEG